MRTILIHVKTSVCVCVQSYEGCAHDELYGVSRTDALVQLRREIIHGVSKTTDALVQLHREIIHGVSRTVRNPPYIYYYCNSITDSSEKNVLLNCHTQYNSFQEF